MSRSVQSAPILLAALMFMAAVSSPGALGQQQQVRKSFGAAGTLELGGSMTFTGSQPVAAGTSGNWVYEFSLLPYAGYFVIEGLELGIDPAGVSVRSSGDTTAVQLRILLAPAYNFHTATIVTPFVEGLAGITSASLVRLGSTTSVSGFTFGGRAGIKAAVTERGMLNIGIQFLRITLNPSGGGSRNGSNELSVSAGWTIWL